MISYYKLPELIMFNRVMLRNLIHQAKFVDWYVVGIGASALIGGGIHTWGFIHQEYKHNSISIKRNKFDFYLQTSGQLFAGCLIGSLVGFALPVIIPTLAISSAIVKTYELTEGKNEK